METIAIGLTDYQLARSDLCNQTPTDNCRQNSGLPEQWLARTVACQNSGLPEQWLARTVACQNSGLPEQWRVRTVACQRARPQHQLINDSTSPS